MATPEETFAVSLRYFADIIRLTHMRHSDVCIDGSRAVIVLVVAIVLP